MDPVCHTLTGAALGETGLKRRTALGMATLMIGANLPDIDVVAVPLGMNLEFRRGWTHGVLAMIVLPLVLTGVMLAWDRLVRRRGGRTPDRPVIASQLLLLSSISVLSHPALDFLNTYGVRLLMPFTGTWFRGDALFIVDPWVLLVLAIGILIVRRRGTRKEDPPRSPRHRVAPVVALGVVAAYAVTMLGLSAHGRQLVRAEMPAHAGDEVRIGHIMVAPVPVHPLRREVVVETDARYLLGVLRWTLPSLVPGTAARPRFVIHDSVARNADHPAVVAAARTEEGAAFLRWSRLPYFEVTERDGRSVVRMADLRYARNAGGEWATRTVVVDTPTAALPTTASAGDPARARSLVHGAEDVDDAVQLGVGETGA